MVKIKITFEDGEEGTCFLEDKEYKLLEDIVSWVNGGLREEGKEPDYTIFNELDYAIHEHIREEEMKLNKKEKKNEG